MGCSSSTGVDITESVNNHYNRTSFINRDNFYNEEISEKILNDFRDKILKKHNELRNKHGSESLSLNDELNEKAQENAKIMIIREGLKTFSLNFYKNSFLGENILFSTKKKAEEICQIWYDESKKYDFSLNKYQKLAGHFTQLIWKETKEVGFGFYTNENGHSCYVALYYPAGNIIGEFSNNIQKAN